jgi:hypothetical protein
VEHRKKTLYVNSWFDYWPWIFTYMCLTFLSFRRPI